MCLIHDPLFNATHRKHANKEIDSKGQPMKPRTAGGGCVAGKTTTKQQNAGRSKGSGNNTDIVCDVCGQVSEVRWYNIMSGIILVLEQYTGGAMFYII